MTRKTRIQLPTDKAFGLTLAVGFAVIGAWMAWKGSAYWIAALAVAAIFALAAFAFAKVLHPLNVAWMYIGHLLNRVVSPLVMGVIFFGLLTPIAAIMRLRGRNLLQRGFDPERGSYWIKRVPPGPDGSSFPRQF
jgi:hypothetical protein